MDCAFLVTCTGRLKIQFLRCCLKGKAASKLTSISFYDLSLFLLFYCIGLIRPNLQEMWPWMILKIS